MLNECALPTQCKPLQNLTQNLPIYQSSRTSNRAPSIKNLETLPVLRGRNLRSRHTEQLAHRLSILSAKLKALAPSIRLALRQTLSLRLNIRRLA